MGSAARTNRKGGRDKGRRRDPPFLTQLRSVEDGGSDACAIHGRVWVDGPDQDLQLRLYAFGLLSILAHHREAPDTLAWAGHGGDRWATPHRVTLGYRFKSQLDPHDKTGKLIFFIPLDTSGRMEFTGIPPNYTGFSTTSTPVVLKAPIHTLSTPSTSLSPGPTPSQEWIGGSP